MKMKIPSFIPTTPPRREAILKNPGVQPKSLKDLEVRDIKVIPGIALHQLIISNNKGRQ
jgi:hypothetical protein